jgi:hypothetical protein
MSDAAWAAVIQEHCKELKLAAMVRDYPGLCRQARDGGWAYEDLLRELLEAEVTNRRQSTRAACCARHAFRGQNARSDGVVRTQGRIPAKDPSNSEWLTFKTANGSFLKRCNQHGPAGRYQGCSKLSAASRCLIHRSIDSWLNRQSLPILKAGMLCCFKSR